MMPNANRRRGAYSGWTRRRGAAGQSTQPMPRFERDLRRAVSIEPALETFPRKSVAKPEADERDKVVVFCLDETGRVLTSGEVTYVSRDDLARRLAEDVRRYPVVEAWQGCICLMRLGGGAWPDEVEDEI